jgi:putative endonuclease
MKRGGCVYIMANQRNGTLYTGVTARLVERVYEHRTHAKENTFTTKYDCNMLVYYNTFELIEDAISEEKRIKSGSRKKKLQLIEKMNPNWNDLWDEIKNWI